MTRILRLDRMPLDVRVREALRREGQACVATLAARLGARVHSVRAIRAIVDRGVREGWCRALGAQRPIHYSLTWPT